MTLQSYRSSSFISISGSIVHESTVRFELWSKLQKMEAADGSMSISIIPIWWSKLIVHKYSGLIIAQKWPWNLTGDLFIYFKLLWEIFISSRKMSKIFISAIRIRKIFYFLKIWKIFSSQKYFYHGLLSQNRLELSQKKGGWIPRNALVVFKTTKTAV